MFKFLGILVGLYTIRAAHRGEVYARSGIRGQTVSKATSPRYFWVVIGVYALLAVALLTIF